MSKNSTNLEISPEDIANVETKLESEVTKVTPRKRKRIENVTPQGLDQLRGDQVIDILEFIHKKYISWLREAEASKYTEIVTSIREKTISEMNQFYENIVKTYEDRIQALENSIIQLNETIKNLQETLKIIKEAPEQAKVEIKQQSTVETILNDDRVKALILIAYEYLKKHVPELAKLDPVIKYTFLPDEFKNKLIEELRKRELGETDAGSTEVSDEA